MRIFSSLFVTAAFLAVPLAANAHDLTKKKDLSDFKLPTEAEIENIIDDLPDFNGLMNGLMRIAQDEDIRSSLERAGESLTEKLETFEELPTQENGMPDLNGLMATMLRTFSDEDFMGDMMDVANQLQKAVEENIDEDFLD